MFYKKSLIFFCYGFFINLYPSIQMIESNNISEVSNFLDDDSLVVFDIDNTLVETIEELGSDQWFSYMFAQEQKKGKSSKESLDAVLPLYRKIRLYMPLILIEERAPQFICSLQEQGFPVIALTAQGPELADKTTQELTKLGIQFSQEISPGSMEKIPLNAELTSIYYQGAIFVSSYDKGKTLMVFLDKVNLCPKKIIFIDDKEKNLLSVGKAATERNIDFIGIRYNRLDEKIKNLDISKTKQQLQKFLAGNSFYATYQERTPEI